MLKSLIVTTLFSLVLCAPERTPNFAPINKFSLKLLENVFAFQENFEKQNIAISPLSIWSIFSLLAEGSVGDTFQELMKTLELPADMKSTQALHSAVKNILKNDEDDVILKGQTAVFTDNTLKIHKEFCETALAYNTEMYSVDPKNTTSLADDINYYICLATEGKIKNVVDASQLENLRMILVDALYFKAPWTFPFDRIQTQEEMFYNFQGKAIGSVNMMFHKAPHSIRDSEQLKSQILEMNYGKNERFSMMILLPFEGMPIQKLLSSLANEDLKWMNEFKIEGELPQVDVYIPRFKVSAKTDLIPPLQYTGVVSIFDTQRSQLPGVSDSPLFVSKTIQNVEIEVSEEGTEAAASTVVGLEDRTGANRFEANKEFVFLIIDRKTNVILFEGIYNTPSLV